jgi:membrane fusion protein (multidrug efflux system)
MIGAQLVSVGRVLVALASGLLAGAAPVLAQPATQPPAVTVVPVEEREIVPSVTFTGRIEAKDKVDLRARVEGFLEQRLFEEGQEVKAGDLLFVLEKAPYQAQIETVNATIARAQATLDLAQIEQRRQAELVKKQATAQAKLDDATARAGEARADLRRQQANLTQAKLDLSYTDVKAPLTGRIGRASFSVGDFVGPASGTLATIVSQDPMYVTFPVTQRQLLQVRKTDTDPRNVTVKARLADGSLYDQVGRINFVDVQVDPGTDTVQVRATLPNPKRLLVDGQLVTAIVETARPEMALVVPQAAVQIDQAGRFVLLVPKDNKVQVQRITIGDERDGVYVVKSGLQAGDRVLTEGLQKVRPGMAVDPAEAAVPQPAASQG